MPRLRRKSRQKLQRLCFLVHREKAERMHGKLQNVRRMSLKFLKPLEIRLSDDEFQAVSALYFNFQAVSALYFNALATRLRAYFGQASGGLYADLKNFI